jgi:hypothetical protein
VSSGRKENRIKAKKKLTMATVAEVWKEKIKFDEKQYKRGVFGSHFRALNFAFFLEKTVTKEEYIDCSFSYVLNVLENANKDSVNTFHWNGAVVGMQGSTDRLTRSESEMFFVPNAGAELVNIVHIDPSLALHVEAIVTSEVIEPFLFERASILKEYKDAWDHAYTAKAPADGDKRRSRINFIVGNPGIGKSWNTLYLLRLGLSIGEMILFTSGKQKMHWLYMPRTSKGMRLEGRAQETDVVYTGGYDVYLWKAGEFLDLEKALPNLASLVWIVDPAEAKDNERVGTTIGSPEGIVARLFTAVSDNPKHLSNFREKLTAGLAVYYASMWLWSELLVIMPFIEHSNLSDELVQSRFHVVGGALRYLKDTDKFNKFKAVMADVKIDEGELAKMLLDNQPYQEGNAKAIASENAAGILEHSAIMKLTPIGVGMQTCKYEFLSEHSESLYANSLRDHVSHFRFGELLHQLYEPLVRHDLSASNTEQMKMIALHEQKRGKAFQLVKLFASSDVEVVRAYPVNNKISLEMLGDFSLRIGTFLIMPTGFHMADFALKVSANCWMLIQATTSERHSYNMSDFFPQCMANKLHNQTYVMVWAVNGAAARKFPWMSPEKVPEGREEEAKDIPQFVWRVRGRAEHDGSSTAKGFQVFQEETLDETYYISKQDLSVIDNLLAGTDVRAAMDEDLEATKRRFTDVTRQQLVEWVKEKMPPFTKLNRKKTQLARSVVKAVYGKEVGELLMQPDNNETSLYATLTEMQDSSRLLVYLAAVVDQQEENTETFRTLSPEKYAALCTAVAPTFCTPMPGLDTTNGNRRKMMKVALEPRNKLLAALAAALAEDDDDDDDYDDEACY